MEYQLMEYGNGFEILNDGEQVGRIVWTLVDDVMIMDGTFIDPSLRGQDAGLKLLNLSAEHARLHQYKMKAVCPYVVKMFERSDAYNDVKM